MSKYPSPSLLAALTEETRRRGYESTEQDLQASLTAVDLFFSSLDTTVVEWVQKMSIDQFFSTVGGQLGLCAGISFLTIVQGFWYLIRYVSKRFQPIVRGSGQENTITRKIFVGGKLSRISRLELYRESLPHELRM